MLIFFMHSESTFMGIIRRSFSEEISCNRDMVDRTPGFGWNLIGAMCDFHVCPVIVGVMTAPTLSEDEKLSDFNMISIAAVTAPTRE
jgi:hypothetical protein